jgi:hypothetical protein
VALNELMAEQLEGVYYWPSFEMVKWVGPHTAAPAYGVDDGVARHVSDQLVVAIIDCFVRAFYDQASYTRFVERLASRVRQQDPLDSASLYELGTVLDFSNALQIFPYKREGWSPPEPGGSWTEGPRASLLLRLRRNSGDLELALEGTAFVTRKHESITIDVEANGRCVGQWHYSTNDPGGMRRAIVPAAVALERRGALELAFTVREPAAPAQFGIAGGDTRLLGLAVKTLSLGPA